MLLIGASIGFHRKPTRSRTKKNALTKQGYANIFETWIKVGDKDALDKWSAWANEENSRLKSKILGGICQAVNGMVPCYQQACNEELQREYSPLSTRTLHAGRRRRGRWRSVAQPNPAQLSVFMWFIPGKMSAIAYTSTQLVLLPSSVILSPLLAVSKGVVTHASSSAWHPLHEGVHLPSEFKVFFCLVVEAEVVHHDTS